MAQPYTFLTKLGLTAALVILANVILFGADWGWVSAAFCGAWLAACVISEPAIRRHPVSLAALAIAAAMAVFMLENPTLLGFIIYWLALSCAVLAPRAEQLADVRRWATAVFIHGFVSLVGPVIDLVKARRLRRRLKKTSWLRLLPMIALPVAGGAVFLALFTAANPVLGRLLSQIHGPVIEPELFVRIIFSGLILVAVWATLRPRWIRLTRWPAAAAPRPIPGVTPISVAISLVVFNALFALQNGLDIAFLWSGARLPDDLTYAEYAHQGVYVLIATALIAGLFVLITLRPGSATAARPLIRRLVVVWVAQNGLLLASSALRIAYYVDAYSLTRMRILAFVVILLVAIGLVLISWRMLRGKSSAWLVNANAVALAAAVALHAMVDTGAVAAAWNVRHAREAGGRGQPIDLCYLHRLGPSALVSLSELQNRPLDPQTADRVAWVRSRALMSLRTSNKEWGGWTWRGDRRLAAVRILNGGALPAYRDTYVPRGCDGYIIPAPTPPPIPTGIEPAPIETTPPKAETTAPVSANPEVER